MTYLELVQKLWQKCGISGTWPGPSTVVNQTGMNARLVTWINDAWKDIQTAHTDWEWMRQQTTFDTVQAQATYPLGSGAGTCGVPSANFGEWTRHTARTYLTSVGTNSEAFLEFISYDTWRNAYQFGALRQSYSRPYHFSIAPDKSICLGPVPVSGYTVLLDYYTAPTDLDATNDSSTPLLLPTQFHMAIVFRAMMYYGTYESAPEVLTEGEKEFDKLMARLRRDRLPEVTFGGALA